MPIRALTLIETTGTAVDTGALQHLRPAISLEAGHATDTEAVDLLDYSRCREEWILDFGSDSRQWSRYWSSSSTGVRLIQEMALLQ